MLNSGQRHEQLKDRRDMRRALIERKASSRSETRRADIDEKIAVVESQIRVLRSK